MKLHKKLEYWVEQEKREWELTKEPKGFRDLMWCPYLNEPTILEYREGEPYCGCCDGNFEAETHEFIAHIKQP